jgi:hypothetical protein
MLAATQLFSNARKRLKGRKIAAEQPRRAERLQFLLARVEKYSKRNSQAGVPNP